jgi:phospholipase C
MRIRPPVLAALLTVCLAAACVGAEADPPAPSDPTTTSPSAEPSSEPIVDPAAGIMNLDHLIFIVQENRSFDHYFGTYPGADGIPMNEKGVPTVCAPDPFLPRCVKPFHTSDLVNKGGPHNHQVSVISVNDGKMDGFLYALWRRCIEEKNAQGCIRKPDPDRVPDAMSYHDRREIPNYWRYADEFILQDRMFAPTDSWTLPAHLYLVSGWSAELRDRARLPGGVGRTTRVPVGSDLRVDRHHLAPQEERRVVGVLRGRRDLHAEQHGAVLRAGHEAPAERPRVFHGRAPDEAARAYP